MTVQEKTMPFPFAPDPDSLSDHELEAARWHPERETLELAAGRRRGRLVHPGLGRRPHRARG